VVVPNVGHAPTLGEPAAVVAIDALLGEVKAQALQGAKGSSGA
jgi:hypothetical protein